MKSFTAFQKSYIASDSYNVSDSINRFDRTREGVHYSLLSTGWKTGSRTRVRNFPSLGHMYAYANKLLSGQWISSDEYSLLWDTLLALDNSVGNQQKFWSNPDHLVGTIDCPECCTAIQIRNSADKGLVAGLDTYR